jgi:hypothetical protein
MVRHDAQLHGTTGTAAIDEVVASVPVPTAAATREQ